MSNTSPYENISVQEKDSSVEITGEIPVATLTGYRTQALKRLGKDAEMDGFRKGHVPEDVLVKKLGEGTVLSEAAELALADAYPKIIAEHELDVIGRPEVTITKLAPENPVGFSIKAAVLKPIVLPDYKAAAKSVMEKEESAEVTDKEVDEMIDRVLKSRQQQAAQESSESSEGAILGPDGQPIASGEGEKKEEEVPELTDELVKSFGDFKDVADFKSKIRESLAADKERAAREKKRMEVVEEIIKDATITIPDMLIEHELDKMLAQFRGDIERMGMTAEDYFKQAGKDEAALRAEWRNEADKRAKLQLILAEIAKLEHIEVPREELDRELEHLLSHYKEAEPERARLYLASILQNEKVFQFLERQGGKQPDVPAKDKKEDAPQED